MSEFKKTTLNDGSFAYECDGEKFRIFPSGQQKWVLAALKEEKYYEEVFHSFEISMLESMIGLHAAVANRDRRSGISPKVLTEEEPKKWFGVFRIETVKGGSAGSFVYEHELERFEDPFEAKKSMDKMVKADHLKGVTEEYKVRRAYRKERSIIWIDSVTKSITSMDVSSVQEIRFLLGGSPKLGLIFDNGDRLYVTDSGKLSTHYFFFDGTIYAGNAVICGPEDFTWSPSQFNKEDPQFDAKTKASQIFNHMTFMDRSEVVGIVGKGGES